MQRRQFYSLFTLIALVGTLVVWYHFKKAENEEKEKERSLKMPIPKPEPIFEHKILKIVAVSDTHTKHRNITVPNGDIFIHSGDFTHFGHGIEDFKDWIHQLPHKHKFVVLGNHEAHEHHDVEVDPTIYESIFYNTTVKVLQDSFEMVEGIKIFGSSWQVQWSGTGFYLKRNGKKIKEKWDQIPIDTKILITHSPSYGPFADNDLFKRVLKVKPLLHIFGHVHEGKHGEIYKTISRDDHAETIFIKASICDDDYNVVHQPVVVNIHL